MRAGRTLIRGQVIELIGDVGAGKTTFVKGLAEGFGVDEDVQSPSFMISRAYSARDELRLAHYDFYRLEQPGVMQMELSESVNDPATIVVVEWADIVENVLPNDRLTIRFASPGETVRTLVITAGGERSEEFLRAFA